MRHHNRLNQYDHNAPDRPDDHDGRHDYCSDRRDQLGVQIVPEGYSTCQKQKLYPPSDEHREQARPAASWWKDAT
jgi:hypothetical protein